MKVVADSHALLYYLFTPDQLSDLALGTLGAAEDSDGVVVSTASLGDLWYSSHKIGKRALTPGAYESLRETVLDPASRFEVVPIDVSTIDHFERFPREALGDPWDRLIVATASQFDVPLVSRDRAISAAGVVEVIW